MSWVGGGGDKKAAGVQRGGEQYGAGGARSAVWIRQGGQGCWTGRGQGAREEGLKCKAGEVVIQGEGAEQGRPTQTSN